MTSLLAGKVASRPSMGKTIASSSQPLSLSRRTVMRIAEPAGTCRVSGSNCPASTRTKRRATRSSYDAAGGVRRSEAGRCIAFKATLGRFSVGGKCTWGRSVRCGGTYYSSITMTLGVERENWWFFCSTGGQPRRPVRYLPVSSVGRRRAGATDGRWCATTGGTRSSGDGSCLTRGRGSYCGGRLAGGGRSRPQTRDRQKRRCRRSSASRRGPGGPGGRGPTPRRSPSRPVGLRPARPAPGSARGESWLGGQSGTLEPTSWARLARQVRRTARPALVEQPVRHRADGPSPASGATVRLRHGSPRSGALDPWTEAVAYSQGVVVIDNGTGMTVNALACRAVQERGGVRAMGTSPLTKTEQIVLDILKTRDLPAESRTLPRLILRTGLESNTLLAALRGLEARHLAVEDDDLGPGTGVWFARPSAD